MLGFTIGCRQREEAAAASSFVPNLWLRIDRSGTVTVTIHKCEMGQGVVTALPMLVAEELEVDMRAIRVEQADADFRVPNQNTSGSSSIIESWEPVRRAGAVARVALVHAAAHEWGVPAEQCSATSGRITHAASGRTADYGSLVATAAKLPLPDADSLDLKPHWSFKVIGTPVGRHDAADKASGEQRYGIDVRVPGMLYAAVLRAPYLNGRACTVDGERALTLPTPKLLSANLEAARALPGVRHVVVLDEDIPARLPARIAVVAASTWEAFQAMQRVSAQWDAGPIAQLSSAGIAAQLRQADRLDPLIVRDNGNALQQLRRGSVLAAEYDVPYLAHAPMEPINCTASVTDDGIEIWAPTQFPLRAVDHAARVTGVPRDRIRLHAISMGGAFGRRAAPDFVVEAVQVSRAVRAPVQVVWTREQDIQQDFFRPATLQRLSGTVDAGGLPLAWLHQLAGPSIIQQFFPPGRAPIEGNEIDAAVNIPYRIPNVRVEWRNVETLVPLTVWRSVAQSQNLFAVESFLDELAALGKHDPVDYRRALLDGEPRLRNVLEVAAGAAQWHKRPGPGRGRGVALNAYGEGTFVAVVAQVAVNADGTFRVERLTCAVDCGQIVNPLSLRAQIEGGLVWGLSATLRGQITVREGRIEQSNFHDFAVLRMNEMPALEIRLVDSHARPGGIGEPCAPPVAPAVANALYAATGQRLRSLPLPERLSL